MINYRNENSSDHIVTIEDPIEFLHTNKRSIVNQREVGLDTKSYSRALRGVMRAAPDVILIGEIRDRESDGSGHQPLRHGPPRARARCTRTTARRRWIASSTCSRRTSTTRSSWICRSTCRRSWRQRLVLGKDGKRVAAVEVMLNTPHIAELVKKGDVISIKEAIIQSGERDIQSFDVALLHLLQGQAASSWKKRSPTPIRAPTSRRRSTSVRPPSAAKTR